MSELSKEFEYHASGVDKNGNKIEFGGTAETLGDAMGGVLSKDDVTVEEWNATQYVDYWTITVCGVKGGDKGCEVKYTVVPPKESASLVAGVASCFDRVTAVSVKHERTNRATFDSIQKQHKEDFI